MARTKGARNRALNTKLGAVREVQAGRRQAEVARARGVHPSTLSRWCRQAREGGLNALAPRPVPGRPRKLSPARLRELPALLRHPPSAYGIEGRRWTLARVATLLEVRYDVIYHPSHVSRLLREAGIVDRLLQTDGRLK